MTTISEWLAASGEAAELASDDDRKWFAGHLSATCRYREAFVGELPGESWPPPPRELGLTGIRLVRMVAVTQLAPGVRVRRAYGVLTGDA